MLGDLYLAPSGHLIEQRQDLGLGLCRSHLSGHKVTIEVILPEQRPNGRARIKRRRGMGRLD
jgi:hypothetical protein